MFDYFFFYNIVPDMLYTSQTFAKLNDVETGLYLESPLYVYDIYKTEKEFGHIVQQEI